MTVLTRVCLNALIPYLAVGKMAHWRVASWRVVSWRAEDGRQRVQTDLSTDGGDACVVCADSRRMRESGFLCVGAPGAGASRAESSLPGGGGRSSLLGVRCP